MLLYLSQPVLAEHERQGASMVDPAHLQTHVRMLAETLAPRDYTHPENLEGVAAYIRQEFMASGGRVSEQEFKAEEQAYRNVIVEFGPATAERIVVGAHYDSFDALPGADDNASGVACLIELA